MFRVLCEGGSVTIDGREITSDMVMSAPSRGPSVLLLNLHSSSLLPHFSSILLPHITSRLPNSPLLMGSSSLSTVFLNCPSAIRQQVPIPPSIEQIILPDGHPYYPIVHTASTLVCSHLHSMFAALFPPLYFSTSIPSDSHHYLVIFCVFIHCSDAENLWCLHRSRKRDL